MPLSADLSWLAGGGEMGALIRSIDWSKTSLGPIDTWPQSLRTSVSLCLSSTFPIMFAWGPDGIQIYNDSYRPICGAKRPESMGQSFKVCWAEALPVVGDAYEHAFQGEGSYLQDQRMFLDRNGYLEEAFMTFSFSPVHAESGNVGGVFHPITETTDKVLGARRTHSLRDLSVHIGKVKTVDELCRSLARQHPNLVLDLPFVLFYQAAPDGTLHLRGSAGLAANSPLAPETVDTAGGPWPFAPGSHSIEEVGELATIFGDFSCGPYPQAPTAALILPISVAGIDQLFGYVVAGVSARRALDDEYRSFYDLLMNILNTGVGNIIAYEHEQKRANAFAEIDRAKTAFFSNVSHEFRTPLTLILGPLDDALTDRQEPLGPQQRARIEVIHRNARRLLKLANSLLDFSKIEAGRAQASYVATDLARLTADLSSVFRSAMEQAGLLFTVDVSDLGEPVYIDHEMWEKIVFNLLSNAFKFTLQGAVEVRLERHNACVRLTVSDTGSGISEAELPRIFERFHRIAGAEGRSYEGTGIGLALINELVKLQGGRITAESRLGQGSAFHVDIPFGKSHLPPEHVAADKKVAGVGMIGASFVEEALRWLPEGDARRDEVPGPAVEAIRRQRARVIVVDDNGDMRAYIKDLLERDWVVEAYADGEAALSAILHAPPDLVVSDVMMPRLDGFGLIQKMRSHDTIKSVPVILLSARAGEEARIEGLQAGADNYLVKPFSANELLARVQNQIDLSRKRRNAQEALEQSEAYFRSLVDTSPAILWITDAQASCTYLSKRWYDYTGRTPEQDLGYGWLENMHPDDRQLIGKIFLAANPTQEAFNLDYRLRRHDGKYRWSIGSGVPRFDQDGNFLGHIGIVIDVHERKCAEEELRRLAAELSEAGRRKSEFLAILAHELRNPLAPIRSGLEVMRLKAGDPVALGKVRDMIGRQVAHMVRLINDLLDIARITSDKVELKKERVELSRVVASAVETSLPLIEAAHHQLAVHMPEEVLWLDADAVRICQVFSNLLNNAAKYTPAGGRIDLSVHRDGDTAVASVADSGIGIPAEALPAVFEMFTQVGRNMAHSQGGLGIGLSLVHRLVELHGGTVSAASAGSGKGSIFTVRLPLAAKMLAETSPAITAERESGDAAAHKLRVLVVDDNFDAAQCLSDLLAIGGHATRVANDGYHALQMAQVFRPDVVILDIGLPDMSGYEVARALRTMVETESAVLVALTGWGTAEDRARAMDAGFDHHLIKPVELAAIDKLLSTIARS